MAFYFYTIIRTLSVRRIEMSDLIKLPNIGVVLEKKLLLAGIENQEKLKKSGVKKLFSYTIAK